MKHLIQLTASAILALSVTACGGGQDRVETKSSDHSKMDPSTMNHSTMDHSEMGDKKMSGDTGHTTGVIFSISPDGQHATIDHQEIDGVGMSAMTMGFGILSNVDLSDYKKGDNVSFMVKKGRDGSYRITAICNTDTDGADCLKTKMDHNGH